MTPARARRRVVVVVRTGTSAERGWLGLRAALAMSLNGDAVSVQLAGPGVGWASSRLDARPWLGGDPGADLAGLLDDAGVAVLADAVALDDLGVDPGALRRGVAVASPDDLLVGLRGAAVVAVF